MHLLRRLLLALELVLAALEACAARARISELGGQLVAAAVAEALVLGGVGRGGLAEDLLDLVADRRVAAVRGRRGIAGDQRAVERDEADRQQP